MKNNKLPKGWKDTLINRFDELKKISLKSECEILQIVEGKEGNYERYKTDLFKQFQNIAKDYQRLSNKTNTLQDISSKILLNSALEGIIKIILFVGSPVDYLSIEKRNRTLGKLKSKLIEKIKEKNNKKVEIVKIILDLCNDLRNNFIHFPFYYEYDYRFDYIYFQLIAFLIETFDYWKNLDDNTKKIIKEKAKNQPVGINLLRGNVLYE